VTRAITVGAAQLGLIGRREHRGAVVKRVDFARHRRPEHYRLIVDRIGAEPPER
jgi:hypothetical protein